jgi:putative Holliday junction resolvase
MENNEILGLDVGTVRTGIARGSTIARLAEPLMSVETTKLFDCLEKLIQQYSVDVIVVGLPRNLSGDDTDQTRWMRAWVDDAKKQLKQPLYWQDEALTSQQALAHGDHNKGHDIDSEAAAIILQDFLDSNKEDRALC